MNGQIRVGIDLARRAKHKAVMVVKENGNPSVRKGSFSFSHDVEGLSALRDWVVKKTKGSSLNGATVNMEPTSGVWEVAANFLRTEGAEVFFTPPGVVSCQRKANSRYAKTDRIDAQTLATISETLPDRMVRVREIEKRIRTLRSLVLQRERLVGDTTRWKNRLISELEVVWQPLLLELKGGERFCELSRCFFKRFSEPARVVRVGRKRFMAWCKRHAHGNTSAELPETLWQGSVKTAQLWELLQARGAIQMDWDTFKENVLGDLRIIAIFEKELERLERRIIVARAEVRECGVLEGLPGVGDVISTTLAAMLLPALRFSSAKKISAYTGYVSRKKSSAEREVKGLSITKAGNHILKRHLALAADVAMRVDAELAEFAIRLLSRGKHYNKVRVAVGRKLAVRAYSLLKRYESGEDALYQWRDLDGRVTGKREAKLLAQRLWDDYKLQKEMAK
jgi:transposase